MKGQTMAFNNIKEESQQLPYLCILSDKRRVQHMKNIKQRKVDKQYKINTKIINAQQSNKINMVTKKEETVL